MFFCVLPLLPTLPVVVSWISTRASIYNWTSIKQDCPCNPTELHCSINLEQQQKRRKTKVTERIKSESQLWEFCNQLLHDPNNSSVYKLEEKHCRIELLSNYSSNQHQQPQRKRTIKLSLLKYYYYCCAVLVHTSITTSAICYITIMQNMFTTAAPQLQTHWHSFFVMSDMESSMILKSTEGSSLREAPLVPTILPLPARNGNIFK